MNEWLIERAYMKYEIFYTSSFVIIFFAAQSLGPRYSESSGKKFFPLFCKNKLDAIRYWAQLDRISLLLFFIYLVNFPVFLPRAMVNSHVAVRPAYIFV